MKAETIPSQWAGLTLVVSATFATDLATGDCTLVLDLAKDRAPGSKALSVRFDGVASLSLRAFGGGLTQILGLDVRDVSNQQWDRQPYEVFDYERDVISFRCRAYEIVRHYTI